MINIVAISWRNTCNGRMMCTCLAGFLQYQLSKATPLRQTYHFTQTHYPDSDSTSNINTNCIIISLSRPGLDLINYPTRGEHINQYMMRLPAFELHWIVVVIYIWISKKVYNYQFCQINHDVQNGVKWATKHKKKPRSNREQHSLLIVVVQI